MGCVSSKKDRFRSPAFDSSVTAGDNGSRHFHSSLQIRVGSGALSKIKEEPVKEGKEEESTRRGRDQRNSKSLRRGGSEKRAAFSIKIGRLTEGEHVAAGWPAWLSAVAGEAVEGWLPLSSNSFERLEKIGQGTYSSVYRARNVETGKMVALKKVRFDNFQPESVRFMAREITILRRLHHQNIMKLEGVITSRLSCSIYLVFEYVEHDLTGLLSCPDVKFTHAQIKCYMRQLLCGLEHCHSRGVIHRDIKASNILVNNEGILKIADFGLGNFLSAGKRQPLTSHVVTLWYRPPELLLGATSYDTSVDLWSVGCVFAELFIGRPLLKGRTEVEQLHKIFKLCGSPPGEYWRQCKLPLATMFKPQNQYEPTLRGRCKEFPRTAVDLLETFLSIEPCKRGTTSSALDSEYFTTKPYACDPSSLPKYPPNKEIDAKFREDTRRKKATYLVHGSGASRNPKRLRQPLQEPCTFCKVVTAEEVETNIQVAHRNNGGNARFFKGKGIAVHRVSLKPSYDTVSETSQKTEASQADSIHSVPAQMTTSSSFAWARRQKREAASTRADSQATSRSQNLNAVEPSSVLHANDTLDSERPEDEDFPNREPPDSSDHKAVTKCIRHGQRRQHDRLDSSDLYESDEVPEDNQAQRTQAGFSGPLILQLHKAGGRQESHTHQTVCRSRFYGD